MSRASTSAAGQHEMTTISDMRRFSSMSSRPGDRRVSYGHWTTAGVAFLLLITLAFIVASGYFTVTMLQNSNINGATWSILTGAVSCGMLTLFVLYLTQRLDHWYDRRAMNGLKLFSMVMAVVSGLAFAIYLLLGFIKKQGFSTVGNNYFSAATFSGFYMGCNLLLYFTAQWYQNILPVDDAENRFRLNRLRPSTNA